jgi:hypothetical protein
MHPYISGRYNHRDRHSIMPLSLSFVIFILIVSYSLVTTRMMEQCQLHIQLAEKEKETNELNYTIYYSLVVGCIHIDELRTIRYLFHLFYVLPSTIHDESSNFLLIELKIFEIMNAN